MFKWFFRAFVAGCAFGVIIAAGVAVKYSLKTSPIFTVTEIEVRGAARTDRERLAKIYRPLVGQNIFSEITPHSLLTDDPWVVKLEMKRVVPNKLVVFVEEEKEVLSYKKAGKCYALTERNSSIPVKCEGVRINIVETPLNSEFNEFVKLYTANDLLKQSDITLKNGFFLVNTGGTVITGTYTPGVFAENYDIFKKQISPRYKSVERVDVTIRGKVYVKGVTNG